MKRFVPLLSALLLASVFLVMPVLAADLQGGYFIVADSVLGDDLTFYVPADYAAGSLTYDESGNLFNLTSSTIYLYCPSYPDYTISASRFSEFQYRRSGAGYTTEDLRIHDVSSGNVEVFSEDPSPLHGVDVISILTFSALIVFIGIFVVYRR